MPSSLNHGPDSFSSGVYILLSQMSELTHTLQGPILRLDPLRFPPLLNPPPNTRRKGALSIACPPMAANKRTINRRLHILRPRPCQSRRIHIPQASRRAHQATPAWSASQGAHPTIHTLHLQLRPEPDRALQPPLRTPCIPSNACHKHCD